MSSIAVIGCGAIGLTTALFLQERFNSAKITIFADKLSPNTTSDIAAGLWEPQYLTGNTPQETVIKWALETYNYVIDLWKAGYAKEAGITLQPVVKLTENENYSPPEWLKQTLGYSVLSRDYLEKLSKENNKNFKAGITFISVTWEASIFLPYLMDKFLNNGGSVIVKTIKNLGELKGYDVIVNCTGMGARHLLQDFAVNPIRGQIARVYAPWQFNSLHLDNNYIIPNINCVILGGTKQDDFNTNLYAVDRTHIFKGCSNAIPALETARIIKEQAGLRPGRTEVRLELEEYELNGRTVRILHNYGHGGSGISLCIGCANEAVSLLENSVTTKSKL